MSFQNAVLSASHSLVTAGKLRKKGGRGPAHIPPQVEESLRWGHHCVSSELLPFRPKANTPPPAGISFFLSHPHQKQVSLQSQCYRILKTDQCFSIAAIHCQLSTCTIT
jgi:hypothetical protein